MSEARAACQGLTRTGGECPNDAADGRPYCFAHDPDRRAEFREHMRGLGKLSGQRAKERAAKGADDAVRLETIADVRSLLERATAWVTNSGEGDVARANAAARLAGVAMDMLAQRKLDDEVTELRTAVAELRRALSEQRRPH